MLLPPCEVQEKVMKYITIINKVLAGLTILSYGLAVFGIIQTGIMPLRYIAAGIVLGLIFVVALVALLLRDKKRSIITNVILGILSLLVIAGSCYAFSISRSTTTLLQNSANTAKESTGTVITKPFVVYISGIDTYGDIASQSRSDVNILAVVNPADKKVLLVTTPRDYYVQLHGTTGVKDKLTHAGIYGIDMSKNTLQDLYGTKIDYTLRINFTSLLRTVDAIGGVEVNSDVAFSAGGYNFVQGINKLDSKQALAFSRERHSFEAGDRQRGKNQQKVIEAIIAKAAQPKIILNYQTILSSLDGLFQTNASKQEISSLIRQQLDSAGQWTTQSISVDGTGAKAATYSMGAQQLYVMIPNTATVDAAKAAIQNFRTVPN